jgi:PAS domain S-box-containing protein
MSRRWADLPLLYKGMVVVSLPLLALVIAAASGLIIDRNVARSQEDVDRTQQVRRRLERVRRLVVDAETAVRGYRLTASEKFLEPFEEAERELPLLLADLRELVVDDAVRLRLGDLERLVALRLHALRDERDYPFVERGDVPIALLAEGQEMTDALRTETSAMEQAEDDLVDERRAAVDRALDIATLAVGASVVLGLGGGVVAMSLFSSGIVRRVRRLEENAHRLEEDKDLLPLAPGEDEIGRLGRAFETTGAAIAQRRAAELARAEAEEETRRARAFLDSVVENIPHMIFVKDAKDLRFIRFNRAGEELLGYRADELVGKTDYDLYPTEQADFSAAKDREALSGHALVDVPEEPIVTRFGGRRILHTKKIPLTDESENPLYLLGISEDITDRKRAEEALRAATETAERANRAKSEFLSRMSHELRTPLNATLGFAQLLELEDLTDKQRESVNQIVNAGRHLLELINEVLDIARIEEGRMTLSPEPIHLGDLIDESVELMRSVAVAREVELIADGAEACESFVAADRQRLKQVLLNLMSNAVKYNRRHGRVELFCTTRPDGIVRVTVSDTGQGIEPESMEKLFLPFDRLGAETSDVEGTGLGLALSKRLVEVMGGSLGVDSTPGIGSSFWVDLPEVEAPLKRLEREPPELRREISTGGEVRSILYIEDNLSNLELIERLLEPVPGVKLVAAMLGGLGIDLAAQHNPDLVLLDLHLPDLSGEDALARLRAEPSTRATPVVVISADATKGRIERLMRAGANGYLTKPLDISEFMRVVDKHLQRKSVPGF